MKCCCQNPDEACGWPPKTVRATMALFIVILVHIAATTAMIWFIVDKQYESALGILATLTGSVGTIIGYYFGSRSGESASKLLAEAEHELIESRNKEIELMERGIIPTYQRGVIMEPSN